MYINWTNISGSLYGAYIPNSLHNVASSDLALAHRSLYPPSRPISPFSLPFYSRLGKHVCMYTHVHKMVFQMKLRIRNVAVKPEQESKGTKQSQRDFTIPSLIQEQQHAAR